MIFLSNPNVDPEAILPSQTLLVPPSIESPSCQHDPVLHTPLDERLGEIRLLVLEPALSFEDAIVCSLLVSLVFTDSSGTSCAGYLYASQKSYVGDRSKVQPFKCLDIVYEALSYVWGNITDTNLIIVDGFAVDITTNLFSVLKYLRLPERNRVLWVDAVCIHQANLAERGHQVQLMGEIYRRASSVIVWLGKAFYGSDQAIDLIEQLSNDDEAHLMPLPNSTPADDQLWLQSKELCQDIIRILTLPWWSRIWTVHEYVLGREVGTVAFQLGRRVFHRKLFGEFNKNVRRHDLTCCSCQTFVADQYLGMSLYSSLDRFLILDRSSRSMSLHRQLARFRTREATDPRDKIYGMLGLAESCQDGTLAVSYNKSTEKVFEDFVVSIEAQAKTLDFLSHLYGQRNLDLPSWVPDWTATVHNNLDYLNFLDTYHASTPHSVTLKLITPRKLSTRGILFDAIDTVGSQVLDNESLNAMRALAGIDKPSNELYCQTTCSKQTAFRYALAGARRHRLPPDSENFENWSDWQGVSHRGGAFLYDTNASVTQLAMRATIWNRRFIVTKKGYFGFVPMECEQEDLIAILAGGSVPYILRPSSDFSDEYTILGDCYIYSIMDGEAFNLLNESERQLREVVLI